MGDRQTIRIGEVAERTSLSLRTLRHYDDIHLVSPSARTEGGFRLYTEQDVARLLIIRRMKPLGYSLEQMRALIDVVDALRLSPDDPRLRAQLTAHRDEAAHRWEQLTGQVRMAEEFLSQLDTV